VRKIATKLPFAGKNTSKPINSALPAITGTAQVGQTLTASAGTWTNSPSSFTYQWHNEGSPISGATSSTYVLQTSDLGALITVHVVASNEAGASTPATAFLAGLLNIMPLGDSITDGYSLLGAPGGYRLPLWTGLEQAGYNIAYVGSASDNGAPGLPFPNHEGHGGCTIAGAGMINTPVTITLANPAVITANISTICNGAGVVFSTTGSLPSHIVAGIVYYVTNVSGATFNIATTYTSTAISTLGDSQSGSHTCNNTTNLLYGISTLNWLNVNPDVILLLIGINDLFAGRTTAQANTDYTTLLNTILADLPSVKIICSSLIQTGAWINTFNANLATLVAASGPRVSLVDMYDANIALSTDNTHPTQAGYNQMAPVWAAGVAAAAPFSFGPIYGTKAFYVSSSAGLDTNPGTLAAPWKTIAKVNAQNFAPGTSVLFKRGDIWDRSAGPSVGGPLQPIASGTAANPIVYDAYGTGANPIIDGSANASLTSNWTNIGTNLWQSVQTFPPAPEGNVTITIGSPAVVTMATGFSPTTNSQSVIFSTTGALPTGLVAGRVYYVSGLRGSTFNVSATPGGTAINTSGSQSGTQSIAISGLPYHNANDIGNILWGFAPLGGSAPAAVMTASHGVMKGGGAGGVWYTPGSGTTYIAGTSQGTWQFNTDNFTVQVYSVGNPATAMPGLRLAMNADTLFARIGNYSIFQNITFQNTGESGIYIWASNVTIRDCVVQWIGGGNNGGASNANSRDGDGVDLGGGYTGIMIERTFFYQMYDGAISPQSGGTPHNGVTIRNNVLYLQQVAIGVLNTPGSGTNVQDGLYIYNNTTYSPSSWSNGQRPNGATPTNSLDLLFDSTVAVSNTDIRNNVWAGNSFLNDCAVYITQTTCPAPGGVGGNTCIITGMSATIWDYNNWSTASGDMPNMGIQNSGGNWPMGLWFAHHAPFEAHGLIQVDPSFTKQSAGDLTLAAGSPLRNAGANLSSVGVVWDFNHKPRPASGPFTIGAFQ
jgi:GDSL-like Lipase/Acylhydrolase family